MEASDTAGSVDEKPKKIRAIQVPFVSLHKFRAGNAFPVKKIDPSWSVERLGFGHTSIIQPQDYLDKVSDKTNMHLENHISSEWFSRPLKAWVDVLVLNAALSRENKQLINTRFARHSNIAEILFSNALLCYNSADMATAAVLISNMFELFDSTACESLGFAVFQHMSDIEFVGNKTEANSEWEMIQTSRSMDEAEFFMLIRVDPTITGQKRLFVPGFKNQEFTSSYRMRSPLISIEILTRRMTMAMVLIDQAKRLVESKAEQSIDMKTTLYKIIDLFIHFSRFIVWKDRLLRADEDLELHFSTDTCFESKSKLLLQHGDIKNKIRDDLQSKFQALSKILEITPHEPFIDFAMEQMKLMFFAHNT